MDSSPESNGFSTQPSRTPGEGRPVDPPEARLDGAPYASNQEHLFDELRRVDLLCNRAVSRMRRSSGTDLSLRGLFISEDEIDDLTLEANPPQQPDERALDGLNEHISSRLQAAPEGLLRLPHLAWLFDLGSFETQTLMLCLAPEIDRKYGKLFAYLQDDVTRREPSADLILSLLCGGPGERLEKRIHLAPHSRLLRHRLLAEGGESGTSGGLAKPLIIDERIAAFLLGQDSPPRQLRPLLSLSSDGPGLDDLMLPADMQRHLEILASILEKQLRDGSHPPAFYFQGQPGAGRVSAASALCQGLGLPLLRVEAERLLDCTAQPEQLMPLLVREARLTSCALYLDQADLLHPGPAGPARDSGERRRLRKALESFFDAYRELPCLLFLSGERTWEAPRRPPLESFHRLLFPLPDTGLRKRLWQAHLQGRGLQLAPGQELDTLAVQFRLTPGRIGEAVSEAARTTREEGEDRDLTAADLQQAARGLSRPRLETSALRIKPLYRWRDIVLPPDNLAQLKEMACHARCRHQVFGDWGFERKMSLGKGLAALFTGPSGSGKTMAAEIMANDLGGELYKIDLSGVVSKYIGETEKNLRRIFEEADRSSAMLFFDEADALFGKRSEVKDAHDRYANIEVNYLLQKIEEHQGIVILASNLQKNIDEAFIRRLRFIIEFPFPETPDRERIWRKVFPEETPLAQDIDLAFLARKFKLTGGHIRSIALHAAFGGLEAGQVSMRDIVRAVRRQFQKLGRSLVKADFEDYFDLLADAQEDHQG